MISLISKSPLLTLRVQKLSLPICLVNIHDNESKGTSITATKVPKSVTQVRRVGGGEVMYITKEILDNVEPS